MEWRQIEDYDYYVSSSGEIRNKDGIHLKQRINSQSGYKQVGLWKNNKMKTVSVHRIVALSFLDNPENKKEVNHIDMNKLNNNLTNLEWNTRSENEKNKKAKSVSGYKHIIIRKRTKPYYLQIACFNYNKSFLTLEEAKNERKKVYENNGRIWKDEYDN